MDEFFNQYGKIILTIVGITALVAITIIVIGKDQNSIVYKALADLLEKFTSSISI